MEVSWSLVRATLESACYMAHKLRCPYFSLYFSYKLVQIYSVKYIVSYLIRYTTLPTKCPQLNV